MIVNFWPARFKSVIFDSSGKWPNTYCAVDVETTGYSPAEDVVTEWGYCLVEDGKVAVNDSIVIDWSSQLSPSPHWLSVRLEKLKAAMADSGRPCHMSIDLMRTEGLAPAEAFAFVSEFVDNLKLRDVPFVLHNYDFDEKMLSANFSRYVEGSSGFTFGDKLIDTSLIEKAGQMLSNPRAYPTDKESLREYYAKVRYSRVTGLKSNLDDHCFRKYQFFEKHGVDKNSMHGAKTDSYCCHLLMQEFAKQIIVGPESERSRPTNPSPQEKSSAKRFRKQRST
jgi:DNA polymerase III epsilon subunit-like protein